MRSTFTALVLFCLLFQGCTQGNKKPAGRSSLFSAGILLDKTSVIYFLNSECPICRKYQGSFKTTYRKFNHQFRFYYVFCGIHSEQNIKDFCDYDSLPYQCAVQDPDGQMAETFGARTTPQVIIIDPHSSGNEYTYSGKIDDRFESISSFHPYATVNYIENALNSLLKNEPVEITETDPVGCIIESH